MKKITALIAVVLLILLALFLFNKNDVYKIDSGDLKGSKVVGIKRADADIIDGIVNDEGNLNYYVNYKDDVYLFLKVFINDKKELEGIDFNLFKYDKKDKLLIDVSTSKENKEFEKIEKEVMLKGKLSDNDKFDLTYVDYDKVLEVFNMINVDFKVSEKNKKV